jgi:hypothetical protein
MAKVCVTQSTNGFQFFYAAVFGQVIVTEANSLGVIASEIDAVSKDLLLTAIAADSPVELKLVNGDVVNLPLHELSSFAVDESILLPKTQANIDRLVRGDSFWFNGSKLAWAK